MYELFSNEELSIRPEVWVAKLNELTNALFKKAPGAKTDKTDIQRKKISYNSTGHLAAARPRKNAEPATPVAEKESV